MKITILGCGGSMGVPLIGPDWGACDPNNPKNIRTRSSILVEDQGTLLLVDTGPDLRQQLLAAGVSHLDAVLYTHAHADHIHGLNDLRPLTFGHGNPIDIYSDAQTLALIKKFLPYPFEKRPEGHSYKPHLYVAPHVIEGEFNVRSMAVRAFPQDHGLGQKSLGFQIGRMAYSTDVVDFTPDVLVSLKGKLDLWIVDCFRREPHPTHAHVAKTLAWIEIVQPKRAVLTHLGEDLDYEALRAELPENVTPAYDGLVIGV